MINRLPLARIHHASRLVFDAASHDGRAMAIAVVDEAAALIYAERMEGCDARVLVHAMRKAYTSAIMKRSTLFFRDQNAELGKTLADWGDPGLTHLPGGIEIRICDEWHGAVGVGGNTPERDVALAELARKALVG
jgi:glc operon protein GlcG